MTNDCNLSLRRLIHSENHLPNELVLTSFSPVINALISLENNKINLSDVLKTFSEDDALSFS